MSDFVFQNPTGIQMMGKDYGIAMYGDDTRLAVMFYDRPVHNQIKSVQQGAPVYDAVPYVKIQQPGENMQVYDQPVKDDHKRRFPRQWKQFVEQHEQMPDGVPIDLLYPGHPEIAAMLRGCNVFTIEQCANMSAHAIETIGMGAMDHVNRAKSYLDIGAGGAGYHRLAKENEDLKMKINQLQRQQNEMRDAYNQLHEAVTRPRTTLPDQQAMIPTRQPMNLPGLPEVMRQAQQMLEPDEPKLDKSFMAAPAKIGKLKKPWPGSKEADANA